MLQNDKMETASTGVKSMRHRNDIEKSTWRSHRYFVNFESRILVEISTSNWCHNFLVDSPFKIDVISTSFLRALSTKNRWWIHCDVYIFAILSYTTTFNQCLTIFFPKNYVSLERSSLDEAKKSIKPLKK